MTNHEKHQLVEEGTHEWCEMCGGSGEIVDDNPYYGSTTYNCGYCDGEGIVGKEMFNA